MRAVAARRIDAPAADVRAALEDPRTLRHWWPRAARVERDGPDAFTLVLQTRAGRPVRADYTIEREGGRLHWRQELAGSPFERFLRHAETVVGVADDGTVTLEAIESPRGVLATLGTPLLRRGARRRLGAALDGLAAWLDEQA